MTVDVVEMQPQHCERVIALWNSSEGVVLTDTDDPVSLGIYFARNPCMSHVAMSGSALSARCFVGTMAGEAICIISRFCLNSGIAALAGTW